MSILAAGCTGGREVREAEPVRVETIAAAPTAAAAERCYVGVVEEESAAALSFPLGGTINSITAEEGRAVRRGDLLALLDTTSARQSYEAAAAAYEQAKDACRRMQSLYDEKRLPEIQWVEARTKLRQAESAMEITARNLADCSLRAPFDGVVGKRSATAGETALPGAPILTLLEIGSVKVRFAVPEQEIGSIGAGDRVRITVAALGGRTFEARSLEKGVKANPVTHTYDVRAAAANPAAELLPGMVCRVGVTPADSGEETVLPVRAVCRAGDGRTFVWTVRGGRAVRTYVGTGRMAGNGIVITEGVATGDTIVTGGMQKIGEGTKVDWK